MGQKQDSTELRAVIQRSRAGDTAAFGQLYEIFWLDIYRVCMQRLGDHHLAEDAVQDVFARARKSLHGFDGERPFIRWLTAIALNRSADIWKANQTLLPIGLAAEIDPLFDARDETWAAVSNNDDRTRISQAASKLPVKTRRVFLEHDYDGVSYPEIAAEDGTTVQSARALVCKARAKMRTALESLNIWILNGYRRANLKLRRISCELSTWPTEKILAIGSATVVIAVVIATATAHSPAKSPSAEAATTGVGALPPGNAFSDYRSVLSRSSHSVTTKTSGSSGASFSPVQWQSNVGPTHPGRIAPNHGDTGVEVVGPNGQVLYRNSTTVGCNNVGTELPNNGPVRQVC